MLQCTRYGLEKGDAAALLELPTFKRKAGLTTKILSTVEYKFGAVLDIIPWRDEASKAALDEAKQAYNLDGINKGELPATDFMPSLEMMLKLLAGSDIPTTISTTE